MIAKMADSFIRGMFGLFGLEIHVRKKINRTARASLRGVLEHLREQNVGIDQVIDIGAAYGEFSRLCAEVFPSAGYLLLEPLTEYRPALERAARAIPNASVIYSAVADHPGEIVINVHPDLVGSSLFWENEDVNGAPRTVPAVTLDALLEDGRIRPPVFLKIDVQGAELNVLGGAGETLRAAAGVMLEVSFFRVFRGGPLFHEIVAFMKERGFVIHDICHLQHRLLDDALWQADVLFVPENSPLRERREYASPEQRARHNRAARQSFIELTRPERP